MTTMLLTISNRVSYDAVVTCRRYHDQQQLEIENRFLGVVFCLLSDKECVRSASASSQQQLSV